MCYKDPGPRCSNHAMKKVQKDQATYEEAVKSGSEAEKYEAYANLQDSLEVFYMTPKGQEQLRNAIAKTTDPHEKTKLQDQLEYGILAREYALADIKAIDKGDTPTPKEAEEARIVAQAHEVALDEEFARKKQEEADTLESFNIDRKARGLMPLSSVNSIALDKPQSGYGTYDNSLIPQAPDLEKVSSIVDAINNGATTATALGESFDMTARDGSYYGNAAEYIGLVSKSEMDDGTNEFTLTENGRLFQQASASDRTEMLKELVNTTPTMKAYQESGKNREQLEKTIQATGYSPEVAKRRASSMITWDKKLNNDNFSDTLASSSSATNKLSLVAAENQKAATEERRSKLLNTNNVRDYGICPNHFTALPASGICSECD